MVTLEQAIDDLRKNITFKYNDNACTTQGEVILLLNRQKALIEKQENDKKKLATLLLKYTNTCPLPTEIQRTHDCKPEKCSDCLVKNLDFIDDMH